MFSSYIQIFIFVTRNLRKQEHIHFTIHHLIIRFKYKIFIWKSFNISYFLILTTIYFLHFEDKIMKSQICEVTCSKLMKQDFIWGNLFHKLLNTVSKILREKTSSKKLVILSYLALFYSMNDLLEFVLSLLWLLFT